MIYDRSFRQAMRPIPKNTPLWATGFKVCPETGNYTLFQKPVLGEYDGNVFRPYKKYTRVPIGKGVSPYARIFADSYEEAVHVFNTLIQDYVRELEERIDNAKSNLLDEPNGFQVRQTGEPVLSPLYCRSTSAMTPIKGDNVEWEVSDDKGATWRPMEPQDADVQNINDKLFRPIITF